MPRKVKELSPIEVKRLKYATSKNGNKYNAQHSVGGVPGLKLQVTPKGAKSWVLVTTVGANQRQIGLGSYPELSLSDARRKAANTREVIQSGIDPIEEKRSKKRELIAKQQANITFDEAAKQFIQKRSKEFKSQKQTNQWTNSLTAYASPFIGKVPVNEIDLHNIKSVLDPIWEVKTETASRVRSRIENILDWCSVHGYRSGNNPAKWQGYLANIYPAPSKIKKVKHHEALPVKDLPNFIKKLHDMNCDSARALEFLILNCNRTAEVIGQKSKKDGDILPMPWKELNKDMSLWSIPPKRMKSVRQHTIPLSSRSIEILRSRSKGNPDDYVFSGPNGVAASNNYLLSLVKRMGFNVTVHGFRSTFKDWCREFTDYPDEVSELTLAHVNSYATRAAYARSELVDKRRQLMNDWELFCLSAR